MLKLSEMIEGGPSPLTSFCIKNFNFIQKEKKKKNKKMHFLNKIDFFFIQNGVRSDG
jgi:hypothetical protein